VGLHVVQIVTKIDQFQFTPLASNAPGFKYDSIRVQVFGPPGTVVGSRKVVFAVTGGGGSVSPATVTTNNQGIAAAEWALGPTAGVNTVSVTVLNAEDVPVAYLSPNSVSFSLRTFNALSPVAGNNQSGLLLAALPVHPSVLLVDSLGKPRPGIPITFSASLGGRVQFSVVSTGADGSASPGAWTLGDTPGNQILVAAVENSTIIMNATAVGTPVYYAPKSVTAGQFVSCSVNLDDTVSCWGIEPLVGDSTIVNKSKPTPTKNGITFSSVVASVGQGAAHVCGIGKDAGVYCWGTNSFPDTSTIPKAFSSAVPVKYPTDIAFTQVAPGQAHNCALGADQNIYCWGDNTVGQLGDRNQAQLKRYSPAAVSGGFKFTSVTSGIGHSCGLATDGSAFCWGFNQFGQLGDATQTTRYSPTAVGSGLTFQKISAGDSFTCGLTLVGQPYCWGNLGPGNTVVSTPKAYTSTPAFTAISSGGNHSCALTTDGSAYCWGDNSVGQLGDSTTTFRANPTAVSTPVKFTSISAGYRHTCGNAQNGAVLCWGFNQAGELGDSTSTIRTQPRYIVLSVTP
jgi:hypothetical protein